MDKFDEYLDRAKDLAEDAGEIAKKYAGEVVSKAKELTEEGGKVRELMESAKDHAGNAKEQAAAISLGVKEKAQGVFQDAKAVKEIAQGISELEALPDVEGSIVYRMDLETMISDLKSLSLIISDKRLDDASVVEEIRKVLKKVEPAEAPAPESAAPAEAAESSSVPADPMAAAELSYEQRQTEAARTITYNACRRALAAMGAE